MSDTVSETSDNLVRSSTVPLLARLARFWRVRGAFPDEPPIVTESLPDRYFRPLASPGRSRAVRLWRTFAARFASFAIGLQRPFDGPDDLVGPVEPVTCVAGDLAYDRSFLKL